MRGLGFRGVAARCWLLALCLGLTAPPSFASPAAQGAPGQSEPPAAKSSAGQQDGEKKPAGKKSSKKSSRKSAKKAPKKATKKPKKKEPLFLFSGEAELQTIYDDNIFRFSDENLLAFRRNENPEKFKLDTYDDFIISPRVGFDLGHKFFGNKVTALRVKYIHWQYASNPDKSNRLWLFRLRQPLMARDAVDLNYSYAPNGYIRELTDREPFESRAVPLAWKSFEGTRNALTLAYNGRFRSPISYKLEVGRVWRYYNRPFLENDNWEWNGAGTLSYRLHRRWSVSGKYQYSNAEARAHDTVLESFDNSDDGDGSYERDLYEGTLVFYPRGMFWKVNRVELTGQRQNYFYTSTRPYFEDQTHTGREDQTSAVELIATTSPVFARVAAEVGYRYSTRSSSSAATDIGADAIEEDKNYEDNRYWLGLTYPF